jgi:hypothetical protein
MKKTDQITVMQEFLMNLRMGEKQMFANMVIYPLFMEREAKTRYLTLKEALEKDVLVVTEKDHNGSVPELRAINKGKKRILLLDGEELQGAKQNRILNTSILLKKESETIIPVSCTESGRWNYRSREFLDSDAMAPPDIRKKKVASVSNSLAYNKSFRSDQREVWNSIEDYFDMPASEAPTRAMKVGFTKKADEVKNYLEAFRYMEGQKGMIVFINGRVEGVEYVSSAKAFGQLYAKLLKSYAMEADRQRKKYREDDDVETIEQFIARIRNSQVTKFKSPGHGYDYRLTGEDITGNSLVYKKEIIHFACFAKVSNSPRRNRWPERLPLL